MWNVAATRSGAHASEAVERVAVNRLKGCEPDRGVKSMGSARTAGLT